MISSQVLLYGVTTLKAKELLYYNNNYYHHHHHHHYYYIGESSINVGVM
jgi:hypothetical protein